MSIYEVHYYLVTIQRIRGKIILLGLILELDRFSKKKSLFQRDDINEYKTRLYRFSMVDIHYSCLVIVYNKIKGRTIVVVLPLGPLSLNTVRQRMPTSVGVCFTFVGGVQFPNRCCCGVLQSKVHMERVQ